MPSLRIEQTKRRLATVGKLVPRAEQKPHFLALGLKRLAAYPLPEIAAIQ